MTTNDERQRVLIVDDDELLLSLIEEVLADTSLNIVTANSYASAEDLLLSHPTFQLILLDQYLDDGLGTDLLRLMNNYDLLKDTSVLMIGGGKDTELLNECFSLGVTDYVVKPLHFELLRHKVDTLLREQKLQVELEQRHNQVTELLNSIHQDQEMARFVYEHLMRRYHHPLASVKANIVPHSVFSGDMILSALSPAGNELVLIADATGHGLAAALTMVPVIPTFATMASKGIALPQIMSEINEKLLLETPDDRFVAAIAIELDVRRRRIRVWNGGMPDAYWVNEDDGSITRFSSVNLPLGVVERSDFQSGGVLMDVPGSGEFVAVSDGLTDSLENGALTPVETIALTLTQYSKGQRFAALTQLMQSNIREPEDDISILSLSYSEPLSAPANMSVHIRPFKWSMSQRGPHLADQELATMALQAFSSAQLPAEMQQQAYTVVSELLNNSLDHGLLGLDSTLKESAEDFEEYLRLRSIRLQNLTESDCVGIEIDIDEKRLMILVKDSGAGYTFEKDMSDLGSLSGRGLALIHSLTDSFEVMAPGNIAKVTIQLAHNQE